MRDFRDAKAMAQTLRETLNAKSVSLTHSESLELIARIFGCRDWNALAARIASAGTAPAPEVELSPPASLPSGEPARQKIAVAAAVLDDYAGFYKFNDNAVFTVTREDDHLLARLTGQHDFPIYPYSPTEFFSDAVDARVTFAPDDGKTATSLILHQHGTDFPMPRIDAATARQISSRTEEKVKSQSASPGTEAALRRLIDGLISGKPNYDEMSPLLAEATRQQLPNLQSGLAELRTVQSLIFLGVGAQGEDVYSVRHENGASHWRIALDSDGTISTAWVTQGP
jgi:Glyoxalase superfamily protein/Domain of unknown function (DUF3471)